MDNAVMAAYEGAFNEEEVRAWYEKYAIIRDTNIASQNVAERLGMTRGDSFIKHYRGVDMPHYLYIITACLKTTLCGNPLRGKED